MDHVLEEILTMPEADVAAFVESLPDSTIVELLSKHTGKIADPILGSVTQHLASRIVSITPPAVMRTLFLRSSLNSLTHFLRTAHPSQLTKILANAQNELISRLVDAAPSHNIRIGLAKSLPVERRRQWLDLVREMEKDIGRTRTLTNDASSSLFEERRQMIAELDNSIKERETILRKLERDTKVRHERFSTLAAQEQAQLDGWRAEKIKLQEQVDEQARQLAARTLELEELNRKQVQQRIEVKVPEYVAAALDVLDKREALFRTKATQWSVQGVIVLTFAIIAAIVISLYGTFFGTPLKELNWETLIFISFKGLVVLGVLGLWAKHAFTVSNAYMHEAIKRSDRAHAINFGKLYLEIYGNSVERKELISIFENWNIASESAFAKANPSGFTPEIIDKVDSIFKSVYKPNDKEKDKDKD